MNALFACLWSHCTLPDVIIILPGYFQDSTANTFEFEIIGGSSGQYAGIAFSPTNQMRDADLYYCTEGGLRSGAITGRHQAPTLSATVPVKQLECNYLELHLLDR